ncbi:hypothetical protein [Rathayibacter sp. VKM Ac-2801]|uniref:hypothetical protein n=1 Tax=Rathayibacter sp. VKM Ac-2801 TaxID=2609255 RepID=UPI00131F9BB0|nr:hypothetical protein [Rathayibacter sp. VKM Ac-2801]QHC69342.1 hypothetical protein GSU45_02370 [Rathayibacter sp. VKM Ac-2801]
MIRRPCSAAEAVAALTLSLRPMVPVREFDSGDDLNVREDPVLELESVVVVVQDAHAENRR